jgi:aminoglycoside phosphotransferase (APT) family kinase protein
MERVQGMEIRETLPAAYDNPAGRRKMAEELIDALVELHAVDCKAAGLTAPPGTYVERQLRRWQRQWELTRARTRELAGLDRMSDWLAANIPPETETTVAHGDYKVDNILYDFKEPKVLAILDWELATLGDPISDIAWLANTWGERPEDGAEASAAAPVTTMEGFPSTQELIEMYGRKSGRAVDTVHYFRLLALFKGAVIGEGIYMRYLEGNVTNPLGARMKESVPERIEKMLEMVDRQA